jgi:hypothetical protein
MSEPEGDRLNLSHGELVSLYLLLNRNEEQLDDIQRGVLDRLAGHLFKRLSVSDMEEIEAYYGRLVSESGQA